MPIVKPPANARAFLDGVLRCHSCGYVFLAARSHDGRWIEHIIEVEGCGDAVADFLRQFCSWHYDLYYCPNSFNEPLRRAQYCRDTSFAWCDIDDGRVDDFMPPPTALIETSPARHQGLWRFRDAVSPGRAEAVSRYFAYYFGGDRNGWSCTKMLRVPFTINHKPEYARPRVRLLRFGAPLSKWPDASLQKPSAISCGEINPHAFDVDAVIARYRAKMRAQYVSLMSHRCVLSRDRSKCIYMIVRALHSAGAAPDEIAAVVWRSPYFVDKHGADEMALANEVHRIMGKVS